MASNDSGGSFVLGFLVGGIVGAAIGLLLAPRSGRDTRAELAGHSEAWRNRAEEMAADLRERVGPAVDNARDRINPTVEGMRDRVSPIVEQVNTRLGRTNDQESNPADAPPDTSSKNGGLDQSTDERA